MNSNRRLRRIKARTSGDERTSAPPCDSRPLGPCVSAQPVLHQGTVAHNLDPFGDVGGARLADALEHAGLRRAMASEEVAKGGSNLSSGERQLLCFARALLQRRPILILDEATSNLDAESDEKIQQLLRAEFASLTLLTIAHRLHTIIDYDTILVLGRGRLREHGPPLALLEKPGGALAAMAQALGESGEAALRQKARDGAGGADAKI